LFEVMLCYYYFNQHQEYLFLKSVPFCCQHVLLSLFLPIAEKLVISAKKSIRLYNSCSKATSTMAAIFSGGVSAGAAPAGANI
jgi:hypothetical protein